VPTTLTFLTIFAFVAFGAAAAGVWFTGFPEVSRRTIPLSGAILLAISLFWVLPELSITFGWPTASALLFAGAAIIAVIDRYVYPICPSCAHTHDHDACGTRLHGFASPLIAASLLHSLFDGWAFSATPALSAAVAIHKIPEGLALGVILRAALKSRSHALAWAAITQLATILGGALELAAAQHLGTTWISFLLALGGGMFLYLGAHAMHGAWKRRATQRHAAIG
jgi:zinc transporter ZupT